MKDVYEYTGIQPFNHEDAVAKAIARVCVSRKVPAPPESLCRAFEVVCAEYRKILTKHIHEVGVAYRQKVAEGN